MAAAWRQGIGGDISGRNGDVASTNDIGASNIRRNQTCNNKHAGINAGVAVTMGICGQGGAHVYSCDY